MAFTENMQHGCVYMTSDKISAKHMFTTRIGGASKGVFASWNLGVNRGDDDAAVCENYRLAGEIMGCGKDDFVVTKQVHGSAISAARRTDFSRISQTAKRMSICAAQMHADLSSSALSARISTCPPSARCAFRRNTGRTVQPTEFAAAWQRRSCSEV